MSGSEYGAFFYWQRFGIENINVIIYVFHANLICFYLQISSQIVYVYKQSNPVSILIFTRPPYDLILV